MTLYKYLNDDGTTPQNNFQWKLPVEDKPGEWMPEITGNLVSCKNGYHVCSAENLLSWRGQSLWTVEVSDEKLVLNDKIVVRQARLLKKLNWNSRVQRLFACDCAERALSLVKNPDERSVEVVKIARGFANGVFTYKQLCDAHAAAAYAAAYAAAHAAAHAAADAAAYAAADAAAASDAAHAAAYAAYAAYAAAYAAYAASAAERKWQINQLLGYIHNDLEKEL